MPMVEEDGDFFAWMDNNDQFNSFSSKAKIFHNYEDIIDKINNDERVDYQQLLYNTGSRYYVEIFTDGDWKFYIPDLELALENLCII